MISRTLKPLSLIVLLAVQTLYAQMPHSETAILTDVLCFHGPDIAQKEYVDVYVSVPYQALQFQSYDSVYAAQVQTTVMIRDSIGRKYTDSSTKRSYLEDNYAVTQGSTGGAANIVLRFLLPSGRYRVEVTITDALAHRDRSVTDTVDVPDFSNTPAISSLMYVSQIEERNGRYAITPYVGNTVWSPEIPLFAFFEYYTVELPSSVCFSWKLAAADGRELGGGLGAVEFTSKRVSQHFLPLRLSEKALPGKYTLTVNAHPVVHGVVDTTVFVATVKRYYVVPRSLAGSVLSDLTLAIKQLAYVATQNDLDMINSATTEADRTYRFEEFWKKQDPTPRTVRNEAFDEYYARIATANRLYRSYTEGWQTDMGRVYVIYGDPATKEKSTTQSGSASIEKWIYPDNRVFVFEDNGFGDYRLRTLLPPDVKYQFK